MSENRRTSYCQRLSELVDSCSPNDPAPEVIVAIEAHIAGCDICAGAEAWLSETVEALRKRETADVSSSFESAMINRLCRKRPKHTD